MPICAHVTVHLVGDVVECIDCQSQEMGSAATVDVAELARLLRLIQGIADGLELAGMTDTAQMVKEHAGKIFVAPQVVWRR